MANLANTYRPSKWEDVTEQKLVVDMLKSMCDDPNFNTRNFLLIGPAGCGKALLNSEKVLSVDGFKRIDEIRVGDKVITETGDIALVDGVFPQKESKDIYELIFENTNCTEHRSICVSIDHLNSVYLTQKDDEHWEQGTRLSALVTEDLIRLFDAGYNIWITNMLNIICNSASLLNCEKVLEAVNTSGLEDDSTDMLLLTDIKFRGTCPCTCIHVDHESHTFVGGDFIPTHNTTLARIMGNYVNEGKGEPIEIDAASNNGIDAVRNIIDQARSYPVGQNWKIFILDECFHKDTLISTTSGYKRICELKKGDVVHNMTGTANVKNVFKNSVPTNHLLLIHLNSGQDILTTSNHLFFTDDGWVEASNLVNGDELYDYSTMRNMWGNISSSAIKSEEDLQMGMCQNLSRLACEGTLFNLSETRIYKDMSNMWKKLLHIQECEFADVFDIVRHEIEVATRTFTETEKFVCFAKTGLYLSNLWKTYEHTKERPQEILFERMCEYRSKPSETTAESCGLAILRYMWESICSEVQGSRNLQSTVCEQTDRAETEGSKITRIFNENETEQSYGESCDGSEDDSDERAKRYFASSACESWRKWSIYKASDCAEGGIGRLLDLRISSTNKSSKGQESDALSYQLQTRPCLSRFKDRNRGGWERPFYEISSVIRRKESHITPSVRVESIEVYKRGDNEQSFRSYFSCEELGEEFVDMYDVEVDGHPSYYANDILVHNCHAFSNQAWQALLKTLESGAGKTLFFMATTNPEKIPATILSRVQTFQLSKISLQGIHDRLCYVLESEKSKGQPITYTDDAVNFVAKMANGGMRDSLTLLDKCLAFSNDITIENVTQALNLPEYDDFFELLSAYAKKNNVKITEIVDRVYNSGVNFVKWFENFHSFVINIVKYIYLQDISKTMIPSTYQDKISKYGNPHLVVCLKLANKLMKMNHELKSTQYLQEVALTNLCFVPAPAKKG